MTSLHPCREGSKDVVEAHAVHWSDFNSSGERGAAGPAPHCHEWAPRGARSRAPRPPALLPLPLLSIPCLPWMTVPFSTLPGDTRNHPTQGRGFSASVTGQSSEAGQDGNCAREEGESSHAHGTRETQER